MKHFLRPYHGVGIVALLGLGAGMVVAPHGAAAQALPMVELLQGASPLLLHSSSQGYLGVLVGDVDADSAQKLKLKEVRGAVITLIDHDAPAGQKGLRVNDVVLKVNGQTVEGAEQFGRMMREIPAGHTATLVISREGAEQTLAIQLVNHRAMEHDVWNRLGTESDAAPQSPGMGVLPGGGDNALPGMFHMPIWGSTLNVGAMVEPLTEQMADYLGVPNGLMVKQVAHKSEAATAGLKAFDVILKVGPDAITTMSDWDRALRSNQGKPVQVTILRDKKQQTLTLQVDSKRKTGELEMEELFPDGPCALTAELDTDAIKAFAQDSAAAALAMKDKIQGIVKGEIGAQKADELRKQAEALSDQLKQDGFRLDQFKLDQKQMDDLKQQMDEFRNSFKPEDFKIDPKQMEEFKRQMERFRMDFKPQDFEFAPN
ncbi:MAG: PDZ domain-containing protein [Terracidiphilus sp.]|nr:PDZ domain-containing protein [Terracidiphilus sp.]